MGGGGKKGTLIESEPVTRPFVFLFFFSDFSCALLAVPEADPHKVAG